MAGEDDRLRASRTPARSSRYSGGSRTSTPGRSARWRPRQSRRSRAELEHDHRDGRSGMPYFLRTLDLRDQLRARLAAVVAAEPLQVALTASTTDGCNIVLAGLGLSPDDEIVTTTDEHFGLLGPLHASGARIVVVDPDPDAIRAAVTPRTRLLALSQVIWTTGRILPVRELRADTGVPSSSTGHSRWARYRSTSPGSTSSRSPGRSGLRARTRRARSSSLIRKGFGSRRRATSPRRAYEPTGSFEPRPEQRASSRTGGRLPRSPACLPPSTRARRGLSSMRPLWPPLPGTARLPRRGASPRARAPPSLRSARRATPTEVVETLFAAGVHVREIPRAGLIRVSCGWWTSNDDLERLVAALPLNRRGGCRCGRLRYSIEGPVRDILVCHCTACRAATGGAWAASAVERRHLVVEDPLAVRWEESQDSEHGASRGACVSCGTVVFWDAPARDTVSLGASTLVDSRDLPRWPTSG